MDAHRRAERLTGGTQGSPSTLYPFFSACLNEWYLAVAAFAPWRSSGGDPRSSRRLAKAIRGSARAAAISLPLFQPTQGEREGRRGSERLNGAVCG